MVDESLGWIQPQMVMLAHKTCISCISPNSTSVSASKFISCSEDGHICLWDSADGRIIDSMRTNYVHRKMKPYACKNLHEILFCVGDYTDVVAIHPHDLNVLYTLNSRAEPDWLNSITLVKPNDKIDVLIGVSLSGVAKLWSLNELNMKDNTTNILFEEESKFIAPRNVHSITCSEKNVRMMLVVCANSWQVIDPSTLGQLVVSECAIEALEGMIVDIDKVAIGFADSTIVLFQLPRSKLVGRQIRERFGEKPSNIAGIEQPFVFALLKSVASPNLQPLLNPVKFFFDSKLSSDKTHRQITYRLDEQSSSISFWHVPKNLELLVSEFVRTRRPIVYEPTIRQCLSDAWSRLSPTPPAIASFESGSTIQATIYVSTQDKLFLGRSDGSIMTMSVCQVIMVALLDGYNNESTQFKILSNGHSSSVTCFLYPFAESNRYDPNLLLSGSADFSVITKLLDCICCIAADNSACFVSLKKLRCVLLASRQQFPIVDIRWRPLSDQILLKCEDDSVYVWNIETGVLDQVITGLASDEILMNSSTDEQLGFGSEDENSFGTASQTAVQMLRALKQKDMAAVKISKFLPPPPSSVCITSSSSFRRDSSVNSSNNLCCSPPFREPDDEEEVILCTDGGDGLLILDSCDDERENFDKERISIIDTITNYNCDSKHQNGLSNLNYLSLKELSTNNSLNFKQQNGGISSSKNNNILLQQQPSLYLDTAKLLISLLHAWDNDESVDDIAINSLKLSRPKIPLCFGTISKGYVSLYTPYSSGKIPALDDFSFKSFSKNIHWQMSKTLTTIHLLAVVSLSNTLMALKNRYYYNSKKMSLRRSPSSKSTEEQLSECESHKVKQSWSNIAALHCILLPERIKPKNSYASPKLDMLARNSKSTSISGGEGGGENTNSDVTEQTTTIAFASSYNTSTENQQQLENSSTILNDQLYLGGINQIRRNQATAIILLGVMGAEFPNDLQRHLDICRATAHSLLELLLSPTTVYPPLLIPQNSLLRRAAIDLLGRGFVLWQPHLDLPKMLIGLLNLAAECERHLPAGPLPPGIQLSPEADACRTARHALSLIASSRPQALITALNMEVIRYNAVAQHQTIQHPIPSPLTKSRNEVLRLLEQLSERQYNFVVDLIVQGMGQSQVRCARMQPAPGEFPVISPGGSYQLFRARLVWINSKSLTLMLPNGKENRFSV
uniref:WD repeat-containing protein 7 n=1 Tax=Meloidogyne javanica TaxID=6303 RepID=A0A915MZD2_MELJA